MTKYLYGVHDWSPVWAQWIKDAGVTATCVTTHAVEGDLDGTSGHDFREMAAYGVTPLARINFSHNARGTIPPNPADWPAFANRCAVFVQNSPGCNRFTIGCEPNLKIEWGREEPVTPEQYAECYRLVYDAIKSRVPAAQIAPAAIGPWNVESGLGWIEYFQSMLAAIGTPRIDWLNLHTYSRGYNPASITDNARMDVPYQHFHNGFRAYLDFLASVPPDLRDLPVDISETNGNGEWPDENTGWVQEAYTEIARHNRLVGTQKIRSLCLFRWKHFPGQPWGFEHKSGVHADFRAAVAGFHAATPQPLPPGPTVPVAPTPPTSPLSRQWDKRLDARGVKIETPAAMPGDMVWRVTEGVWLDEQQAGGRHHIYVDIRDSDGSRLTNIPLRVNWPSGSARIVTEAKPGELWSANYPMSPSRNEFSIRVDEGGFASETVSGIGMGAETPGGFNPGIHTSTGLVFQRVPVPAVQPIPPPTLDTETTPVQPATAYVNAIAGLNLRKGPGTDHGVSDTLAHGTPVEIIGRQGDWLQTRTGWLHSAYVSTTKPPVDPVIVPPPEPPTQPTPSGNDWPRIYAFILKWEGGWADHPQDPGGATMKGITIGTYTRWREAQGKPQPTKADLRNISDAEVQAIYREWYWKASGADRLAWPMNLVHMDTSVNAGVGKANEMLQRSGGNFLAYMGHLIDWYTRIETFPTFGRAWIRRRAEILLEAAK